MSRLTLFLFGTPRIERDGVALTVDTRKAVALLAYLVMTRQRQSRDTLATLLWPDYDQPHARAALRRTLSALNKTLAGAWLEIDREAIGLLPVDFYCDVDEFQRLLAACQTHSHSVPKASFENIAPLTKAMQLYSGDFMAGFHLQDSASFDDWQFFQADSLRRDLARALEQLVHLYSVQADFEHAIAYARRWLSLDRLHEPAHRQLMTLYAASGQHTAALHQYQECVQVLQQELGVAPLEETTQLYEAIKTRTFRSPFQHAAVPLQTTSSSRNENKTTSETRTDAVPDTSLPVQHTYTKYPLVGRGKEWSNLQQIYAGIHTQGHVIILEGEAGIGKTRLAEEFLAFGRDQGARGVEVHCYEGETHLAYGPIVAALRAALLQGSYWKESKESIAQHWLNEVARLLPELTNPETLVAPPLDSPGAQSRFFESIRQVLLTLCGGKSREEEKGEKGEKGVGILFLDDVQWADAASLDVLNYIIHRLHDFRVCLVLTWRTEREANRLQALLTEGKRSQNTTIFSLARLDQGSIQDLVRAVPSTDMMAKPGLAQRLYQETEGLPFFLTEYLNAMTNGTVTKEEEVWLLPNGIRDLLSSRLIQIPETSRQILGAAATIGRSFDFDTVLQTSGRGEEETVLALEELLYQGVVKEVREGTGEIGRHGDSAKQLLMYDFSHEKLRNLVYEQTSLARRRLLHRRVAEALVTQSRVERGSSTLAGKIARHYLLAGNEHAAAEYFYSAGQRAQLLYAHAEALAHFRSALSLGYPDTAGLYQAIGDMYTFQGEYSAALKHYQEAIKLTSVEVSPALAALKHKLGTVYERRGEWQEAEHHFSLASRLYEQQSLFHEQARVYADWSLATYHHGHIAEAAKLAQHALTLAENTSNTTALAQAHNMLGILAHRQGDFEQARSHLERSLELAQQAERESMRIATLNNLALVCQASGDAEHALELLEEALTRSTAFGDRHREAALHSNLADTLYGIGRSEQAMLHLKSAVSIYAEIGVEAGTVQPEIWKLAEW